MNILENKIIKNYQISTKKLFTVAMAIGTLAINPLMLFPQKTLAQSLDNQIAQINHSSIILPVQIQPMVVNITSGKNTEFAGILATPFNIRGKTIPAGSIVSLVMVPTNTGDVYLKGNYIINVNNGESISIQAESSVFSGEAITEKSKVNAILDGINVGSSLGRIVGTLSTSDFRRQDKLSSGGAAIGTITALISGGKKKQIVQLNGGLIVLNMKNY